MILRAPVAATTILLSLPTLLLAAAAAPDIITLADGYHYIAKLPCTDCPFLYHDTATNTWLHHNDDNALLLNITLEQSTSHLTINNAPLLSTSPSTSQPRIHAPQVPQDYSTTALSAHISTNDLDTAGPALGLSYGTSLHRVANSTARVFRFNVFSLHFALADPPARIPLSSSHQRVLELVLLPRPLRGAADTGIGWEIATVRFSEREKKGSRRAMRIMSFDDWDEFGRKGSPVRGAVVAWRGLRGFAAEGVWALGVVVVGVVCFVVAGVLGAVFVVERWAGVAGGRTAAGGKGRTALSKGSGNWADLERARGRGDADVGVGKSD